MYGVLVGKHLAFPHECCGDFTNSLVCAEGVSFSMNCGEFLLKSMLDFVNFLFLCQLR